VAVDAVILSALWTNRVDTFNGGLLKTVNGFRTRHIPVLIVGPSMYYNTAVASLMARRLLYKSTAPFDTSDFLDPDIFRDDLRLQHMFGGMPGVQYLSVLQQLCRNRQCPGILPGFIPIVWDNGHLTAEGSLYIARKILTPALAKVFPTNNRVGKAVQ